MKQKQLKPKDPKKTFIRLFSYFKYNIVLFFGGIFFIIAGSLAEIGINGMISPVIDALIGDHDSGLFVKYLLIMVALVVIISISQYITKDRLPIIGISTTPYVEAKVLAFLNSSFFILKVSIALSS
jgi:ABC-type multidrug transport system fused ATPase/permease subunit